MHPFTKHADETGLEPDTCRQPGSEPGCKSGGKPGGSADRLTC